MISVAVVAAAVQVATSITVINVAASSSDLFDVAASFFIIYGKLAFTLNLRVIL